MKNWILIPAAFLFMACGGEHATTALSATPGLAARPTAATPTLAAPQAPPAAFTRAAAASPIPTTTPANLSPSLPATAAKVALGPAIPICTGDGLSVAADGIVFTWGRRDGQPCASAINVKTDSVEKIASATLSPPLENDLEVSDPARGRAYVARNDAVIAFDCCENEIGTVFVVPSGEPPGSSFVTALRFDQHTSRLYVSYQDFDGQAWIASIDLATGEALADVPIPLGPWALGTGHDRVPPALADSVEKGSEEGAWLVFVDANTLVILNGATLELVYRLSLSHRPASAVTDPAGTRLFVTDAGGDLYVLDAKTMVELDRQHGVGAAVDEEDHSIQTGARNCVAPTMEDEPGVSSVSALSNTPRT